MIPIPPELARWLPEAPMSAAVALWAFIVLAGHAARAVSRAVQRRRYGSVDEKLANRWRYFAEFLIAACLVLSFLQIDASRCSPARSETWAACAATMR